MARHHRPYPLHVRLLALLTACAFCYLYIGSTAFVHTHYVDGQKVAHSHPYSAPHQHANAHAVAAFALMGAALTTPPAAPVLTVPVRTIICPWPRLSKGRVRGALLHPLAPRAPPFFGLSAA